MANWFYAIMLAAVFISMWISVQQLAVAALAMDFAVITFYYSIPSVAMPFVALINIVAFATAYFYKPFTPGGLN